MGEPSRSWAGGVHRWRAPANLKTYFQFMVARNADFRTRHDGAATYRVGIFSNRNGCKCFVAPTSYEPAP